jgi:HD-GYP domain-containing protein (c-di-GMP phosphodiesterase class II)
MYDALSSHRPYRAAMSHAQCCEVMVENAESGGLDPEMVRVFFEIITGPIVVVTLGQPTPLAATATLH